MIYNLICYIRYAFRRILFQDDCILCSNILLVKEYSLCKKCLENLKNISSLKKYKNVYYLWLLDERFFNLLNSFKNRLILAKDLVSIIEKKFLLILENEKISKLDYKSSEFFVTLFNKKFLKNIFRYINLENDEKLIFREYINKIEEDENIYFSFFVNTKLLNSKIININVDL